MKQRTGIEAILLASRTTPDSFIRPFHYETGDLPGQMFETVFNRSPLDLAVKLEAYSLVGVDGMLISPTSYVFQYLTWYIT